MADKSAIEWTDATWTPIRARNRKTGKIGWHCEHATTGCVFCYSEAFNMRLGTGLPFKPGHRTDIDIFLDEEMLTAPLRWKKPRMIFVCSMTDLFADFVPDEWIDRVFAVMALAPQHTFQVLTKRAKRMREYMSERWQPAAAHRIEWPGGDAIDIPAETEGEDREDQVRAACEPFLEKLGLVDTDNDDLWTEDGNAKAMTWTWPLRNVWLGVSAERQQEADERIPELLATPAALRFVSAEPLLGPIDFKRWTPSGRWAKRAGSGEPFLAPRYFMTRCELCGWSGSSELCGLVTYGDDADVTCPACKQIISCDEVGRGLDWIIAGGESGKGARPMHPAWARLIREQCRAAGVPFFFKQWGAIAPVPVTIVDDDGTSRPATDADFPDDPPGNVIDGDLMCRVGKKAAGRLLDGVEHNARPQVAA